MTRPFDDDMAGGRAVAEEDTTEEAIYDAAHEMLATGRVFHRCPGCDLLVHHADRTTHAKVCAALRDLAMHGEGR